MKVKEKIRRSKLATRGFSRDNIRILCLKHRNASNTLRLFAALDDLMRSCWK